MVTYKRRRIDVDEWIKNIIKQNQVFSGCVRSYEVERRITQFYAPRGNDGGRFVDLQNHNRWKNKMSLKLSGKEKTDEIKDKAVLGGKEIFKRGEVIPHNCEKW